jgi:hypothetical protein
MQGRPAEMLRRRFRSAARECRFAFHCVHSMSSEGAALSQWLPYRSPFEMREALAIVHLECKIARWTPSRVTSYPDLFNLSWKRRLPNSRPWW